MNNQTPAITLSALRADLASLHANYPTMDYFTDALRSKAAIAKVERAIDSLQAAEYAAFLKAEDFAASEYALFAHNARQAALLPAGAPADATPCNPTYFGRGYVENGVFKGFTGPCFRCQGRGYQTEADRRRNWGYDNFYLRIEGMGGN